MLSATACPCVAAVSLALLLPLPTALAQLSPEAIAKQVPPAVAKVMAVGSDGKLLQYGSGFAVESGNLLVTNAHVVRGAHRVDLLFPDGRTRSDAIVVASDSEIDLAVLVIFQADSPSLQLADETERPQVGAAVYVVGGPLGLSGSFSKGVVSGWRSRGNQELLQISAPISAGSSGGPVVDATGHVIGVAIASLTTGQDQNFAVSVRDLRALLRSPGSTAARADSTAAGVVHYKRLISDFASEGAYGKALEVAAQAVAKYPGDAQLYLLVAQLERKAGRLDFAISSLMQAFVLDPKAPGANLLLAQMNVDTGKLDEAIAAVKADVAADATNKERDAQFLLGLGSNAYKAGVASKNPEDFEKAIRLVQASDEVNPTPNAKFFGAISAWHILAPSLERGNSWNCANARAAEAKVTLISANMPASASVSPDAAAQIMSKVPQAQRFIDAQTKRLCK